MNNWTIAGRIGKDAEVRHTAGGDAVCNFSVAVSEVIKREKVTTWVNCSLWGDRGQKLAAYLTKGTAVALSGDASVELWTSRDGDPRLQLRMRVNQVTLLGGGEQSTHKPVEHKPVEHKPVEQNLDTVKQEVEFADEIPF